MQVKTLQLKLSSAIAFLLIIAALAYLTHLLFTKPARADQTSIKLDSTKIPGTNCSPALSGPVATWQHTTSGNDRLLLVMIAFEKTTASSTGVTYSGNPMTLLASETGSTTRSELWYQLSPATGTNDVKVSHSPSNSLVAACASVSFMGVNQGAPFGTVQKTKGTSSNFTSTIASAPLDVVFDFVGHTFVNRANVTTQGQIALVRTYGRAAIGSSYKNSSQAQTTMGWSLKSLGFFPSWTHIAVPLKPAQILPDPSPLPSATPSPSPTPIPFPSQLPSASPISSPSPSPSASPLPWWCVIWPQLCK